MADDTSALRAYWFVFDLPLSVDCPRGAREGVGVTAHDRDDAIELVVGQVFDGRMLPSIVEEHEDVEFHRLCPWLVLPNMTDPRRRGVWFPIRQVRRDQVAMGSPRLRSAPARGRPVS
jgi:hypothetical protein